MLQVNVALPSGCSESLSLPQFSKVGNLRILAQRAFGLGIVKLITAEGHILADPEESLEAVGLRNGDHLTAVVLQPKLAATERAFALWCCGGHRIVTWGDRGFGGDSSEVRNQLKNVQQVQPPAPRRARRPPGPVLTKVQGAKGEENLQGILWPPASRRARRPRALC